MAELDEVIGQLVGRSKALYPDYPDNYDWLQHYPKDWHICLISGMLEPAWTDRDVPHVLPTGLEKLEWYRTFLARCIEDEEHYERTHNGQEEDNQG